MEIIIKELIELIDSKQGSEIKVIEVKELAFITDYISIVTTTSLVHSKSLAKYIIDFLSEKKLNSFLLNKNLDLDNNWVLIDGGEILVNLFTKETRDYYNLEKLYFKGNVLYEGNSISAFQI